MFLKTRLTQATYKQTNPLKRIPPFNLFQTCLDLSRLVQTCPLNFNTVSSLYASMIISSHPPPPIVSLVLRYLICTAVRFSPKKSYFFTFFLPEIIFLLHLPPSNISKTIFLPASFFLF